MNHSLTRSRQGKPSQRSLRHLALGAFGALAALALVAPGASADTMLDTVSFPGPSMSAHPVPIIHAKKLDEKYGSKHDWNIRTTAAAYLNDFYTNVYNGLHVSGVSYLAANYNKGTPIRIIGGVLEFPYPVMTRADSGINTIQESRTSRARRSGHRKGPTSTPMWSRR